MDNELDMVIKSEIPNMIRWVERYQFQLEYNNDLLKIVDGALLPFIEESLAIELSPQAYQRAKERIPPINILKRLIEKLSPVYAEKPERLCEDEGQTNILTWLEDDMDIDNKLSFASELINLHKYCLIELYPNEIQNLKARVIPADRFLPYSWNKIDPTIPTAFILMMGKDVSQQPVVDKQGVPNKNSTEQTQEIITLMHIYTNDLFMVVESNGHIRSSEPNPLGLDKFVYINTSEIDLIPQPDSDNKAMAVLIPKLLADLNYVAQFTSHSITYGIDLQLGDMSYNPDSFLDLKSEQGEGKKPTIGVIKPEADIEAILKLIQTEMAMWLETKGIDPGKSGNIDASNAVSGVAKIIDESDTTELRKKLVNKMHKVECDLWNKVKQIFDKVRINRPSYLVGMSDGFEPMVEFAEQKAYVDPDKKLDSLIKKLENKLTSHRRAVREANPELSPEEIDTIMQEILEEGEFKISLIDNKPELDSIDDEIDSEEDVNDDPELE